MKTYRVNKLINQVDQLPEEPWPFDMVDPITKEPLDAEIHARYVERSKRQAKERIAKGLEPLTFECVSPKPRNVDTGSVSEKCIYANEGEEENEY